MAGGIKGITVKIGGDTTELGRALSSASKQSTALQKELKGVNTLLKYDPRNVTLLKQKQDLLTKSVQETKTKLNSLKEVLAKADAGEIQLTEEEYRNLQREIASTEQKLKNLTNEQKKFGSVGAQQIAQVGEKLKEYGGKVESAGKAMLPVTGAIGGLGAMAVKTTADFDASMSNVSAISGATGEDLDKLRAKAREMGSQTKFSASESADAMSYMAMAGWKTNDMIDGISGVMDLASASGEDLAKTSDILTDGLTAFGLSAKDSGRMADVMASASSNANTNVSLLGESYKYCASTAGAMGYSVEDVTESLGLMANAGVKGSQAGTSLKNAMINMAKPTKAMAGVMDKYGISITKSDGSMKSWNEVVDNLRGSLGGLSEAEQTSAVATLFGKEATAGMLSVINAGPEDVEKLNTAINNSAGSAKAMADTMNDNLSGQLTILKSQLEELAISFGELLMPAIRGIVSHVQAFVDKLNSMSETQRKVIVVIALVVASIAPLLIAIGKVMTAVGTIMTWAPKIVTGIKMIATGAKALFAVLSANPIALVVIAITALIAGLIYAYNHCEKFRTIVNNAFKAVKEVVGVVIDALVVFFTQTIPDAINSMVEWFKSIPEKVATFLSPAIERVSAIFEKIKEVITTVWTGIQTVISTAIEVIKTILLIGFALIMNLIVPIINAWITIFTTCWNTIKTVFSTALNIISSVVSTAFNAVKNVITTVFNAIVSITAPIWERVKSAITTAVNAIRSVVSSVFNSVKSVVTTISTAIKTVVTTAWNGIKSVTSSVWNGIKSSITSIVNSIKSTVSSVVNSVKSTVSSVWNGIKAVTTSVWNSIKNAIISPIRSAKATVESVINGIKSTVRNIFNGIKPRLHLSLPHISVSGGSAPWGIAGKGSLPSFHVSWNKLGAIFKRPTIFATDQGLQGVGEAGAEAVAPITELMGYVHSAVNSSEIVDRLGRLETTLERYLPGCASGRQVVLDSGAVVGELIDPLDNALSDKYSKLARGW